MMTDNFRLVATKNRKGLVIRKLAVECPEQPGRNEVLVEALKVAVCGSDRERRMKASEGEERNLFHEIVGMVVCTGEAVPGEYSPGTRVSHLVRRRCLEADELNSTCDPQNCFIKDRYRSLSKDGVRKLSLEKYWNLVPVPENLSDDAAVLTEPVSLMEKIVDELSKTRDRWPESAQALVTGVGIGVFGVFLLTRRGFVVTSADLKPATHQRAILSKRLGAQSYVETDIIHGTDMQHLIKDGVGPYDIIIEAIGHPQALTRLLPLAAVGSTVVAFGLPQGTWVEKLSRWNITILGLKEESPETAILKCRTVRNRRIGTSSCIWQSQGQLRIGIADTPSATPWYSGSSFGELDILIDNTGDGGEFLERALEFLAPNSVVAIIGERQEGWARHVADKAITVLGCVNYGPEHSRQALTHMRDIKMIIDSLGKGILQEYSLRRRADAFRNDSALRAIITL